MADFKELADLKRCPFCGGEAKVFTYRNERERTNPTVVKCKECGTKTATYYRYSLALQAWNERVSDG